MDYDTMSLDEIIEELQRIRTQVDGNTSVYLGCSNLISRVELDKSFDWQGRFAVKIRTSRR
jgi:hypothetical protein